MIQVEHFISNDNVFRPSTRDGPKGSVTGYMTLFKDVPAYRNMHQSIEHSFFFLYNDIKHIVKRNNLAELHAQIDTCPRHRHWAIFLFFVFLLVSDSCYVF